MRTRGRERERESAKEGWASRQGKAGERESEKSKKQREKKNEVRIGEGKKDKGVSGGATD